MKFGETAIYDGWTQMPLAKSNQTGYRFTDTPPTKRFDDRQIHFITQGWQRAPIPKDNLVAVSDRQFDVPRGTFWNPAARWIFDGWQKSPLAANNAVAAANHQFDLTPRGRDLTRFIYDGWQQWQFLSGSPMAIEMASVVIPLGPLSNPKLRWIFDGWVQAPRAQDNPVSFQETWTEVPRGVDRLDKWSWFNQAMPPQVPPIHSVTDMPSARRYDMRYDGWFEKPGLQPVLPPLRSSMSFDLPLSRDWKLWWMYLGNSAEPIPGNVIPPPPRIFMPLMGVGTYGP